MSGSIDDLPRVMGEDGEFHAQDEAVDLVGTPPEAWVALAFFWALGLVVIYQFITRYLLNDSAAWTEEIARYLLIATVFTGATIGVIRNNHIQVDFFYRYMPARMARVMATAVDVSRIAFFFSRRGADIDDDGQTWQQFTHDGGGPANELGLWGLRRRFCGHGLAVHGRGLAALAARLQRA